MNVLCIPTVGDELILGQDITVNVVREHRNTKFLSSYAIETGCECNEHNTPVTLIKNTVLKVDRIYLRKGAGDFDSLTFILKSHPKYKKLKGRFFVSLEQLQGLKFTYPAKEPESEKSGKDVVNQLAKDAHKEYQKQNPGALEWESRGFVADRVLKSLEQYPVLETFTLDLNVTKKLKSFESGLLNVNLDNMDDNESVTVCGSSLKVRLAKEYIGEIQSAIEKLSDTDVNKGCNSFINDCDELIDRIVEIQVVQINKDTVYLVKQHGASRFSEDITSNLKMLAHEFGHPFNGFYYKNDQLLSLKGSISNLEYTKELISMNDGVVVKDHKALLGISVDDAIDDEFVVLQDSKGSIHPSLKKSLIKLRKEIKK